MIIDDHDPDVRQHGGCMPRRSRIMRLNRRDAEPVGEMLLRSVCRSGEAAPLGRLLPSVAATAPAGRLSTLVTPAAARWPVHLQHTRQILINLVGNAVRYSAGPVRLGARQWAGRLRLTVADEGTLGPRLVRAVHRHTPPKDDNGLGLWVVRNLAALHGGRLQARRGRTGGLVMEVVLPRYRA
jgi:signal transduction histidine kinase